MNKWYGEIGFDIVTETDDGVWTSDFVKKNYYGDFISKRIGRQSSDKINDDIRVDLTLSILADEFACHNCAFMAYAMYNGIKWKISNVEPEFPRLKLTLGGVYNG